MNIAVLSLHLPSSIRAKTGGVAYVAHRLANGLVARGHNVTVFSTDARPADAQYQLQYIPATFTSNVFRNWWQNWKVARGFAKQDYAGYDVIHAHGDDALLWRPGPPVVRTLHGAALAEAIHAPSWQRKLWYLSFTPREMWEAAKADVTVAVSARTRRYVPFVDQIIPNTVDHGIFHPDGVRSANPTILFVGTLAGRKRGQMLVDIFQSEVRPSIPSAELWLVAEQPVDAPGVTSYLRPDEAALAGLYRRAWLFCLPSAYEGFGVPYIEAMACGTPVVATPNPGAREVLGDGAWGVLVRPDRLGQTLIALLGDAQRRQEWSLLGRERAKDFTLDVVLDAYESVFRDVARRRH